MYFKDLMKLKPPQLKILNIRYLSLARILVGQIMMFSILYLKHYKFVTKSSRMQKNKVIIKESFYSLMKTTLVALMIKIWLSREQMIQDHLELTLSYFLCRNLMLRELLLMSRNFMPILSHLMNKKCFQIKQDQRELNLGLLS